MNNLIWLQSWYAEQTNGDWEHQYGIQIETLDNPGWHILIDLEGTDYEESGEGFQGKVEHGEDFWYHYQIKEGKYEGWGDSLRLNTLVGAFKDIIEPPGKINQEGTRSIVFKSTKVSQPLAKATEAEE